MKAIRFHAFGGPDVLSLDDVPDPRPKDGEVLVRVASSGVNPVDISRRAGRASGPEFAFPAMLAGRLPASSSKLARACPAYRSATTWSCAILPTPTLSTWRRRSRTRSSSPRG